MSTQNQTSINIPEETIATVISNLQECRTLLAPYLHALTPDERQTLFKLGDKTVATVLKTKEYVETNPQFVPSYMDQEEFANDVKVVNQLSPITNLATQLHKDVEDTMMLVGSEALQEAMLYYGQVKEASHKGILSAEPIYRDLKERFARRPKTSTPT